MPDLRLLALWYFAFLFSLVVHEASHAWASLRLGDDTAFEGGQVSLDPRPHIQRELFGTVLVPIITFLTNGWMMGWGSAPYDPRWAAHNPRSSALVSLAGPASNLGIAVICGLIIRGGVLLHLFTPPDYMNFSTVCLAPQGGLVFSLGKLLSILFSLNILLCVFNLLPVPPLDGSGIVPLFIRGHENALRYTRFISNPAFYLIGILLAWRLIGVIFGPAHTGSVNLLYWGVAVY